MQQVIEVLHFLIALLYLVVFEELVNLTVQEYLLVQMSRHFLVVLLHEVYDLFKCRLLTHVLKDVRDKEVEDLVRVVEPVYPQDLLLRLPSHVVLSQEVTSEP